MFDYRTSTFSRINDEKSITQELKCSNNEDVLFRTSKGCPLKSLLVKINTQFMWSFVIAKARETTGELRQKF